MRFDRRAAYVILFVVLLVAYLTLRGSTWRGSAELHTLMESLATLLAFFVGVMALVRFYSKRDNTLLFVGTAFLGTASLDGYHAIVTSRWFAEFLPSGLASLIPWSWVASRLFLALFLLLSWYFWKREDHLGSRRQVSEKAVYVVVGFSTLAAFLFFAFVPLPRAYYPELFFHRPEELLPALLFLGALVGYLLKGKWRDDSFEHWLVMALIVSFMGQAMFMSFSGQLFDGMFDIAHMLKKVSYVFVLTGLMISMYRLFRQGEDVRVELANRTHELGRANTELENLLSSKNQFLASVSHELRTPLTSVVGFAELLRDPTIKMSDTDRQEMVSLVAEQGFDLANIIEDLLVAARSEAGELEVSRVPVNVSAQAAQVLEALGRKAEIPISVNGDAARAVGDPGRVRQVIRNLLTNALKYGGGNVRIEVNQSEGSVLLEVIDNGPGVAAGEAERIFEPYSRGHTQTEAPGSVGIGLAISRELAGRMNGDLRYTRRNGETVFQFALPTDTPQPQPRRPERLEARA